MKPSLFNEGLRLLAFLFIVLFILSCSATSQNNGSVKGEIVVVGEGNNSQIALKSDDNNYYVLECNKEIFNELIRNQGAIYLIAFDEIKEGYKAKTIVVKEIKRMNSK